MKQGCILAPTLFTIFFSMMLHRATEDLDDDDSVYIRYRTDGSLFNLRHQSTGLHQNPGATHPRAYADDAAALVSHSETALQRVTSCFAEVAQLFGLEVSLKETGVLHQPAPQEVYRPPYITIGETELSSVQQFTNLGAPFPLTQRLTKRSTTDWPRPTTLSAGSTVVSGTTNT